MGKIYITVGISGSGKSRLAKIFCSDSEDPTIIELNADNYRKMLAGDVSSQELNKVVFDTLYKDLAMYLAGGYSVFISNTNLHASDIKKIAEQYRFNDIEVLFMKDSEDIELCWSRIQKDLEDGVERSNVPRDVLEKQFEKYKSFDKEILKDLTNINLTSVDGNNYFSSID